MRKIENVINNRFKRIKEYRGLPINVNLESNSGWVYGCLLAIDEFRNLITYDANNPQPRKAIIRMGCENLGMGAWTDIEVHLDSVGQNIGFGYFENDIIQHKDFPDCLFEIVWSRENFGWFLKLTYGYLGDNIALPDIIKIDSKKCTVNNWTKSYEWYPKENIRYFILDDIPGVFIGYEDEYDVWFNSMKGNAGEFIFIDKEDTKTGLVITKISRSLEEIIADEAIHKNILERVINRKLIKI